MPVCCSLSTVSSSRETLTIWRLEGCPGSHVNACPLAACDTLVLLGEAEELSVVRRKRIPAHLSLKCQYFCFPAASINAEMSN